MNKKEIIRDQRIVIKVSKEEKELWENYANEIGSIPTRLARNILLDIACEECKIQKKAEKWGIKAYEKFAKLTGDKDALDRIERHRSWHDAETQEEKDKIEEEFDKIK